jgi:Septum formation
MRRLGALAAVVLALALAACSSPRPAGTDGDLVDGWPAMGDAHLAPAQEAGTCRHYVGTQILPTKFFVAERSDDRVARDCAVADDGTTNTTHDTETAYAGTFTGADAEAATPPADGSAGRKAVYGMCQNKVSEYLGGDWHAASVWILLVLPSDAAWHGGARWFRCDVGHVQNPITTVMIMRGSVHNGLSGSGPLAITCLTTQEGADRAVEHAAAIGCDQPHAAEYAGYWTAPEHAWLATQEGRDNLALLGCAEVVAHYLGLPNSSAWTNQSIGYLATGFDQERWAMGDRTTRCFAYAYTKSKVIIGSVKGIKNGTPKS